MMCRTHILQVYCGVTANKAYQLADWRIRPLTDEMLLYAREESHYLLYLHERLKQELGSREQRAAVWQRSLELCR